jgi:Asp-tRNA(Asn)/Glu-tRNA(Gln) amidotransferase A subunit family amidase
LDRCGRRYVSGRTTARAVTQAHLDRIAAYDKRGPLINSLITVDPRALEEADRLDSLLRTTGQLTGPLHGIPVIVKDNIDVAGLPMTSGFQGWKNYHPSEDAPLVTKIRAAGGIILAKSSLSEFGRGGGDNILSCHKESLPCRSLRRRASNHRDGVEIREYEFLPKV